MKITKDIRDDMTKLMTLKFEKELSTLSDDEIQERYFAPLKESVNSTEMYEQQKARISSSAFKEDASMRRWTLDLMDNHYFDKIMDCAFETLVNTYQYHEFDPIDFAAAVICANPIVAITTFDDKEEEVMTGMVNLVIMKQYEEKVTGISRSFEEWATVMLGQEFIPELYEESQFLLTKRETLTTQLIDIYNLLGLDRASVEDSIAFLAKKKKPKYEDMSLDDSIFEVITHRSIASGCPDIAEVLRVDYEDKFKTKFDLEYETYTEGTFIQYCDNVDYTDVVTGEEHTLNDWMEIFDNVFTRRLYLGTLKLYYEVAALEDVTDKINEITNP